MAFVTTRMFGGSWRLVGEGYFHTVTACDAGGMRAFSLDASQARSLMLRASVARRVTRNAALRDAAGMEGAELKSRLAGDKAPATKPALARAFGAKWPTHSAARVTSGVKDRPVDRLPSVRVIDESLLPREVNRS
jgi:hypothetical protein